MFRPELNAIFRNKSKKEATVKDIRDKFGNESKIISVLFGIAVVILVITMSIGLPIYIRQFYYAHIDALNLSENTGYTKAEIYDAYDDVLDYLTIPGEEFGTGNLPHSEEGRSHFADCKKLFDLNAVALLISFAAVLTIYILSKVRVIRLAEPFGFKISFFAGIVTLALFLALAVVVLMDFQTAFFTFHRIFFPGKSNWLFNPLTDPIILIMPRQFFMNCAILICSSIISISSFLVIKGIVLRTRSV